MKILILGGFLGSGKTTLLLQMAHYAEENSVSEHTCRVAILKHEIGRESVDNKFLQSSGFDVETLFDEGICSGFSDKIVQAAEEIENRYRPDWLFIEAAGLDHPEDIRSSLKEGLKKNSYICTVVDVSRWKRFLVPMYHLLEGQIACADAVLLNKTDLAGEEVLNEVESDINHFQKEGICFRTSGLAAVSKGILEEIEEGAWRIAEEEP